MDPKLYTVAASQVEKTELVLPDDTNPLGNLLGGRLLHWMDIAMGIAAARHSGMICVTASVDQVNFLHPVHAGEIVILKASVNRVFNTSLETGVKVFSENIHTGEVRHTNSAYMTFVGLNAEGAPTPSRPVVPETEEQLRRFEDALRRRNHRLLHKKEASHES